MMVFYSCDGESNGEVFSERLRSIARKHCELLLSVNRAHRWQQLIDDGRVQSISGLARHIGLDQSYVARTLKLTLLAPDITEAIFRGLEPSGLSFNVLTKTFVSSNHH